MRVIQGGRGSPPPGLLAELYEKHAAQVYARCRFLLRDDEEAKDALHDVFAKALRSLEGFRGASSPSTWIQRIATHHCLNVLRARRTAVREATQELRLETEPPDRRELVRSLLAAVPEEAQEIAVLYWVDELTQVEIAEVTGRSLPTVRKRLREFLTVARGALKTAVPELSLPEGAEL